MKVLDILNIKFSSMLTIALLTIVLTGSFMITEKLSLPLALFSIIFFVFIKKLKFIQEDILIFAALCLMLLFGSNGASMSGIIYMFAFCFVWITYSKSAIHIHQRVDLYKILMYLSLISSIFIIYEFTTRNFISSLYIELPRHRVEEMDAIFLGLFQRARGFAEEPAHMGLFYEFALPLLFIRYKDTKSRLFLWAFSIITVLAIFCIFSVFTMATLSAYFILYMLFKTKISTKLKIFTIVTLTSIAAISFHPEIIDYLNLAGEAISNKLFMGNSASASDRILRFNKGLEIVSNHPFGIGPMNMSQYSIYPSSLNLYLDLLMFFGPFVLITFLIYIGIILYKAFRIGKWTIFASTFIILAHYCAIANFWYPYLWFLFGIIQYDYSEFIKQKQAAIKLTKS